CPRAKIRRPWSGRHRAGWYRRDRGVHGSWMCSMSGSGRWRPILGVMVGVLMVGQGDRTGPIDLIVLGGSLVRERPDGIGEGQSGFDPVLVSRRKVLRSIQRSYGHREPVAVHERETQGRSTTGAKAALGQF